VHLYLIGGDLIGGDLIGGDLIGGDLIGGEGVFNLSSSLSSSTYLFLGAKLDFLRKNMNDLNSVNEVVVNEKEEQGASMVEYALLVALIAVIAIVAIRALGTKISAQFSLIGDSL